MIKTKIVVNGGHFPSTSWCTRLLSIQEMKFVRWTWICLHTLEKLAERSLIALQGRKTTHKELGICLFDLSNTHPFPPPFCFITFMWFWMKSSYFHCYKGLYPVILLNFCRKDLHCLQKDGGTSPTCHVFIQLYRPLVCNCPRNADLLKAKTNLIFPAQNQTQPRSQTMICVLCN